MTHEEVNDSPIEQVRLTVPVTDDPNLPVLTVRAWVLGMFFCALQSSITSFMTFRNVQLFVPTIIWQLSALSIGKFLAATVPAMSIRVPGTKFNFSLNPGPFNIKEHAMISVMSDLGFISPVLIRVMATLKVEYLIPVNYRVLMVLTVSTQMLGFGLAAFFVRLLVENPLMWWPSSVVNVVLYRTLHHDEQRGKGHVTKLQFLIICIASSFAYDIFPNFFIPILHNISILCLLKPNSVRVQQLGSGMRGLGLGAFGFSWETIAYAQDPFITPPFALHNAMFGFVLYAYVITPIAYSANLYRAKWFPLLSEKLFTRDGELFEVRDVIDENFMLDESKFRTVTDFLYMPISQSFQYGLVFAASSSAFLHAFLVHGKSLWYQMGKTYGYEMRGDVHNRLMDKYKKVPAWWFWMLLLATGGAGAVACHRGIQETSSGEFHGIARMRPWLLIPVAVYSVMVTIPNGVLKATSNQLIPISLFSNLIVGYSNRGKTFENMILKAFLSEVPNHILMFNETFKFGHYMKLPPRLLFAAVLSATGVASFFSVVTAIMMFKKVDHLCDPSKLPPGTPWGCPILSLYATSSTLWNIVGPARVFFPYGRYKQMMWFFLIGFVVTLLHWLITKVYRKSSFINGINLAIIFSAPAVTPPVGAVHWWSSYVVGVFNHVYVYNNHKRWWGRYNYLFSTGCTIGSAFSGFFQFLVLQVNGVNSPQWKGVTMASHCPLDGCPTAKGAEVKSSFPGCPVF